MAIGQHTVGQRKAWNAIIALLLNTRMDDVVWACHHRPSLVHDWSTSSVVCHHHLWTAHSVRRHRAWHAFGPLGRNTWSNNVGHGMP